MFFQIVFLVHLYEEKNHFSLSEVLGTIAEKMVHRHPHVFGDETVSSEQDQKQPHGHFRKLIIHLVRIV